MQTISTAQSECSVVASTAKHNNYILFEFLFSLPERFSNACLHVLHVLKFLLSYSIFIWQNVDCFAVESFLHRWISRQAIQHEEKYIGRLHKNNMTLYMCVNISCTFNATLQSRVD